MLGISNLWENCYTHIVYHEQRCIFSYNFLKVQDMISQGLRNFKFSYYIMVMPARSTFKRPKNEDLHHLLLSWNLLLYRLQPKQSSATMASKSTISLPRSRVVTAHILHSNNIHCHSMPISSSTNCIGTLRFTTSFS